MVILVYAFYALVSMNGHLCRRVRIDSVILKDIVFISSKSRFNQCGHN